MVTGFIGVLAAVNAQAVEINGFTQVSFFRCTNGKCAAALGEDSGRNGNFAIGNVDLYIAQAFDQVDVLLELNFEDGTVFDLERLRLGYTFSDAARLYAGRVHTPLGFWNNLYHHGDQLAPTIERPEFLKFEDDGGIIPVHTVGVAAAGRLGTDLLVTEYQLMLGNGPKVTSEDGTVGLLDPNNITDNNRQKSVAGYLSLAPRAVPGLKFGLSGHLARVQGDDALTPTLPPGLSAVDLDQRILNGSVMYEADKILFLGEYYAIQDKDLREGGVGSNTNSAYYALLSYALTPRWVPYAMYEAMALKEADPYVIALGARDLTELAGGVRFNISWRSSVKAEVRSVNRDDNRWAEYAVQWALGF